MTPRAARFSSIATSVLAVAAVIVFAMIVMRSRPVEPYSFGMNGYIGRPAPDFTLTGLDGQAVTLSSLKGKIVVLDLWATWCPQCVVELPTNRAVTAKYADRGVVFYAINLDTRTDVVREFLDRYSLSLPVLLDPTGSAARQYGADYLPLVVVIDATGRIVAHDTPSPEEAEAMLTKRIESALASGQAE